MNNKIDELRKHKGLTWEQLASELNMSKAVIWRFGKGIREIKQSDLQHICNYFGVSADYLLGLPNQITTQNDDIYVKIYDELKDLDPESQQDILNMVSKMKEMLIKKGGNV